MKKNYLAALLMLIMSCLYVSAQTYHEDDKEGLRQFLTQNNNFQKVGLTTYDIDNWETSEDWIPKLKGIIWNSEPAKRVLNIAWELCGLTGSLNTSKFNELTMLNIQSNSVSNLDISKNIKLVDLNCNLNYLASLDISKNSMLVNLNCSNNRLTSLNISKNINLEKLYCTYNKLTSLDVSENINLEKLCCSQNKLISLDISGYVNLKYLECFNNQLTSLSVLNNIKLEYLYCSGNQLTSLDVSENSNLQHLHCSGNQFTNLDVSENILLEYLSCSNNQFTSLDISKNSMLKNLECSNNQFASLDISKNSMLVNLECSASNLTNLDLSKNIELEYLSCSNNQFTSLDISKNNMLAVLYCPYNQLTNLNLSNNIMLLSLDCSSNQLRSLDVSKNSMLEKLYCTNNQFTSLDVSKNINLGYFDCSSNLLLTDFKLPYNKTIDFIHCSWTGLKFSKLPLNNVGSMRYINLKIVTPDTKIGCNQTIDLSSEYIIDGQITTYKWTTSQSVLQEISLISSENGKFVPGKENAGKTLCCTMTNSRFPYGTLSYTVTIDELPLVKDHLKLNTSNDHLISKDQTFQVYASTTLTNPDALKFGLYNPLNATLRDSLTIVSRKDNIYTCQLRSNTDEGSYMLMPYVNQNGEQTPIERENKSPWIDKLPIKIENNIWTRSLNYTPSETVTATKYMQLNISSKVNQIFTIDQFQEFMVNIPTSVPTSARIGLFYLNGDFYTDITTARSSSTYKCTVNDDVMEGNYILMPYVKEGGVVKTVERIQGSFIIDRLPLYVVAEDIWGDWGFRQAKTADTESTDAIQIYAYPNPVTDVLYLKGIESSADIEIYTLSGNLVKKISVSSSEGISLQSLSTGVYAVKVTTAKGQISTVKIQKK